MTYTIRDIEYGTTFTMSLKEIIEEINRDRCEDWLDYDETDWREGLRLFTTWEIVKETTNETYS
jgi:cobalamin biosynthesis Co2+ chelatase CbiK